MLQSIPTGFARPVFESQSTFRVILEAMSRPGTVVPLPVKAAGPAGWSASMTSMVLTLCDMNTPVWLDGASNTEDALRFLRFHCGCPLIDVPAMAAFAVVTRHGRMPSCEEFSLGSAEYPEKSTTVLLASDLSVESGEAVRISGPGVEGEGRMPLSWLPSGFIRMWGENYRLFPRGIDVILVGRDEVVGLPRTLKMEGEPCM